MSCYMTYVHNMLCNMCHNILSRITYIMLCYSICSECFITEQNMLYDICHVI